MGTPTKGTTKTATDRPMKAVGKKYASVSELIHDTSEPEFAREFDQHQDQRRLVNCLTVIRCVNEVSQEDLAKRMDCTQSKVSKMETSIDDDLNFGDVVNYAKGLRQAVHIMFVPEQTNGANHVRFHIECIKQELGRLVKLAGDDEAINNGVETFALQQAQRMVEMVEETIDSLPHRAGRTRSGISVEAEGERGRRLPIDDPKRQQRVSKRATTAKSRD